jgi:hypothetical protein
LGESLAEEPNALNDGTFGVVGSSAKRVLAARLERDAKEYNRREALLDQWFEERN